MPQNQRYFIELAYNGTRYHGWQSQPNALGVQQLVDEALSTVFRCPIETIGAGRTDTGVHAKQLFAHFNQPPPPPERGAETLTQPVDIRFPNPAIDSSNLVMGYGLSTIDSSMDSSRLRSLNALLPPDISIKRIFPVHAGAHARFDAILRSYEYHIHFEKDPFLTDLSWQLRDKPNVTAMNKAAAILMEYTDFSCFSKSHTQVKTNNCKIQRAEWAENNGRLVFYISADRFLRNMVRAIVGTLLMAGKGEIGTDDIRHIIESKNRSKAGTSVPACGLYLTEVKYPGTAP